jgi:hypothetical protein
VGAGAGDDVGIKSLLRASSRELSRGGVAESSEKRSHHHHHQSMIIFYHTGRHLYF